MASCAICPRYVPAAPVAAAVKICPTLPPRAAAKPPATIPEPMTFCRLAVVTPTAPPTYLPTMGVRYEPRPVSAALFNTSLTLPPEIAVIPPLTTAAPTAPATAPDARPPVTKPPMAGKIAGAKIATAGRIIGATFLTTFLIPDQRSLKNPYSGKPVAGLMVPMPPMLLSMAASSELMCANWVSPTRPLAAVACNCSGLTGPATAPPWGASSASDSTPCSASMAPAVLPKATIPVSS